MSLEMRNGRPPAGATAANSNLNTADPLTTEHDAHQGSRADDHSAVLHAVRLRPCGRRQWPDDIVMACGVCGWAHRFRPFENSSSYARRLPCKPWLTARIEVVRVLPVAGDVALVRRGAA